MRNVFPSESRSRARGAMAPRSDFDSRLAPDALRRLAPARLRRCSQIPCQEARTAEHLSRALDYPIAKPVRRASTLGLTTYPPHLRFDQHRAGIRSAAAC
jgi:hypothetical protein